MGDVLSRLRSALGGRYTLERELGHGGMATVWLARDVKHERPVALKVLRPEVAAALGPERFLREITVTAGLRHPHILPLLDSFGLSSAAALTSGAITMCAPSRGAARIPGILAPAARAAGARPVGLPLALGPPLFART